MSRMGGAARATKTLAMATVLVGAINSSLLAQVAPPRNASAAPVVVFVCEHGTVKSLVALEYFNRLAALRGLDARAISRGTAPDSAVPGVVRTGLASDGFDVAAFHPQQFRSNDLNGALLVVALDADVDRIVSGQRAVLRWDGLPSLTRDYVTGRAAIAAHVEHLVDSLASARRPVRSP